MSDPLDSLVAEHIMIRAKNQILRESSLKWLFLAKNIGFELSTKFFRLFQGVRTYSYLALFTLSDAAALDVSQNLFNRVFA